MKISFADPIDFSSDQESKRSGILIVGVLAERVLTPAAAALDAATGGEVTRVIGGLRRFTGKAEETLWLSGLPGTGWQAGLLVGLGTASELDTNRIEKIGGAVRNALASSTADEATLAFDLPEDETSTVDVATMAAHLGYGVTLRSYRFDKYKTQQKPEDIPALKAVAIGVARKAAAKKAYSRLQKIADGVFLTRDLVSEPANELYPEVFAERCQALGKLGLTIEVLDQKKLRKLGMGALLSVSQGSAREARVVVMSWNGGKAKDAPIAFVGKGVTFDTGGISLKPAAGMEDMKMDMGGAGVVTGLMAALAGRKAKVNAVGVIGLVENMPSATATRPGDVVKSMSGKTIEILNTDAEGRLVLADVLHYTQDRFKPEAVINLATLTGAIIVALGEDHAGVFTNNDGIRDKLLAASSAVGEQVWAMPLGEGFDRQLDSEIADVKNIGSGRFGGASVAGQFLKRFVSDDVPWAHLDIAGVTWSKKDRSTGPRGATGFGVRLLDRLVADNFEG